MDKKTLPDRSRRQFVKQAALFIAALPAGIFIESFCQSQSNQRRSTSGGVVGGGCEGCEGIYEEMPSW